MKAVSRRRPEKQGYVRNHVTISREPVSAGRAGDRTAELSRSGIGPFTFAETLARENAAYRSFDQQQRAGADFEAEAGRVGREMREKFYPQQRRPCRAPVTAVNDSEQDWAARVNEVGARMRR